MKFIADFHVHSRYSRATSKKLDLESLYVAACLKGISVIGTGDFTHPGWFSEIKEKLVPAEQGLFKLRDDLVRTCDRDIPDICKRTVRFLLVSEISNIYKKNNRTRKNHNLVFVPDLMTAERFNSKLDRIGNIKSDGRPILGLDARNLLEILMETSDENFLIPAHIWTPWFSLLGSKSGFDSIEECFEDLTPYIFGVETGLSSDPEMNWRISGLDHLTLVSNSDAHSAMNLGREANLFDTKLSYLAIKDAMETGDEKTFLGTIEFYPEEGKYHLDGHRKCNLRLWPKETIKHNGICPVCGKPLTLGVLYRVEELADRPEGAGPEKKPPFYSTIPLKEILSEILSVGSGSKKVAQTYHLLINKLGSEFEILLDLDPAQIDRAGVPLVGQAIQKMRQREISIFPGYDGEFGKIKIFSVQEREAFIAQKHLFQAPATQGSGKTRSKKSHADRPKEASAKQGSLSRTYTEHRRLGKKQNAAVRTEALNEEQLRAVRHPIGPMIIVAGPGTGKTRTITHRIAHLLQNKSVLTSNVLAITFTNKAAREMEHRLTALLDDPQKMPLVTTFHSFCYKVMRTHDEKFVDARIIDDEERRRILKDALKIAKDYGSKSTPALSDLAEALIKAKQKGLALTDDLSGLLDEQYIDGFSEVFRHYQHLLRIQYLFDFEDIILLANGLFKNNPDIRKLYQEKYPFVFIDEYQDLNHGQYTIVKYLAPPEDLEKNLCVIGDPNQCIYGFRGSDKKFFEKFTKDYPRAEKITLTQNYRCTETILSASSQVVCAGAGNRDTTRIYSNISGMKTIGIIETLSEKAEAVAVGQAIEELVGGTGFHSIDFDKTDGENSTYSFSDFAVFYRTTAQARIFTEILEKAGIPCQLSNKQHVFGNSGIKDLISLFRLIDGRASYHDMACAISISAFGVGKKSVEALKNWGYANALSANLILENIRQHPVDGMARAAQKKAGEFFEMIQQLKQQLQPLSIEQKITHLIDHSVFSKQLQNLTKESLDKLLSFTEDTEGSPIDFLNKIDLQTDADLYNPAVEKVSLMSMHAAKGLEFPVVFISGCENGFIPFYKTESKPPDMEEERRLFYVAMTRAKDCVYITYAKKRKVYGRLKKRQISPFVLDIEEQLKTQTASAPKPDKTKNQIQLNLFQ